MSLQKQIIPIPVSGGVDTKTDAKLVPAGKSLVLENARFIKTGRLSKRFGLTTVSDDANGSLLSSKVPYAVIGDQDSLNVISENGVYGYSESLDKFYEKLNANIFPTLETQNIFKDARDAQGVDCDHLDNFSVYIFFESGTSNKIVLLDRLTGNKRVINEIAPVYNYRILIVNDGTDYFIHVTSGDSVGSTQSYRVYDIELNLLSSTIATPFPSTQLASFDLIKTDSFVYYVAVNAQGTTDACSVKINFDGTVAASQSYTVAHDVLDVLGVFGCGLGITQSLGRLFVAYIHDSTEYACFDFDPDTLAIITANFNVLTSLSDLRRLSVCPSPQGVYLAISTCYGTSDLTTNFNEANLFNIDFSGPITGIGSLVGILSSKIQVYNNDLFCVYALMYSNIKTYFLKNVTKNQTVSRFAVESAVLPLRSNIPEFSVPNTVLIGNQLRSSFSSQFGDLFQIFAQESIFNFETNQESGTFTRVGESFQYVKGVTVEIDDAKAFENGFYHPPFIEVTENTGTPNPNVASKTFLFAVIYEFYNSAGEICRSAPSNLVSITTTANAASIQVRMLSYQGIKTGRFAIFRSDNLGQILYKDGDTTSNVFNSAQSDASLITNETIYTTGGVIQNDPAPMAKFSCSGNNRIFLGGLDDKDLVAYSKKQLLGETVNFSDQFTIRVSSGSSFDDSNISGLGYMDGKLIIFRENSIYFVSGDGPTEAGTQNDFTDPEIISSDTGCFDPKSVLNVPSGLMFKSRKGIYLLTRSLGTEYIGADVEDFNNERIVASLVHDKFNEARFYTEAGNCLVYNFLFGSWSVFKGQTTKDASIWKNEPVAINNNFIKREIENTFTDDGLFYSMKMITPWLKLDAVQGFVRVYRLWIIGNFKSVHTLKLRLYVDYREVVVETYNLIYSGTEETQYQFDVHMPYQKVQAIKFEIFDESQSGTGESYDLSNMQVEVGIKTGGYKIAASKKY